MAVTRVGVSAGSGNIAPPVGVSDGDLLTLAAYNQSSTASFDADLVALGWTVIRSTNGTGQRITLAAARHDVTSPIPAATYQDYGVILAYSSTTGWADFATAVSGSLTWASGGGSAPALSSGGVEAVEVLGVGNTQSYAPGNRFTFTGISEQADSSVFVGYGSAAADSAPARTASATVSNAAGGQTIGVDALLLVQSAPNAPILDVPSLLDRNVTNRFNLTASDPDVGDTTSQTDWRYREIGAPSWTTVSKTSPTTFYDFAAGTFLGTDYEIQARTYDALGEVGPYSSSSFFTANDAPDQPTWVDPLNGQTIGTASYTGTISAPDVDESEWRLVADNAGVIDEATVLHGPVLKTTGDVRSHTFTGLTNGVTVWWQARTKFGGLWSQWAAVRTPVAYTPPPAPTVTPAASNVDGAVSVTVSTPAPGAGEPTVTHVDLYVRDTTGADTYRPAAGIRWAMFRVPNGVTVDWLAASGINYEYQAVAHGDNGTTAASAWTAIDPDAVATIYYGGY